jgi:hypothetical protein
MGSETGGSSERGKKRPDSEVHSTIGKGSRGPHDIDWPVLPAKPRSGEGSTPLGRLPGPRLVKKRSFGSEVKPKELSGSEVNRKSIGIQSRPDRTNRQEGVSLTDSGQQVGPCKKVRV